MAIRTDIRTERWIWLDADAVNLSFCSSYFNSISCGVWLRQFKDTLMNLNWAKFKSDRNQTSQPSLCMLLKKRQLWHFLLSHDEHSHLMAIGLHSFAVPLTPACFCPLLKLHKPWPQKGSVLIRQSVTYLSDVNYKSSSPSLTRCHWRGEIDELPTTVID